MKILKTRHRKAIAAFGNTLRLPAVEQHSDFDAGKDLVPVADMLEIDRYAIAQMNAMQGENSRALQNLRIPSGHLQLQMYARKISAVSTSTF